MNTTARTFTCVYKNKLLDSDPPSKRAVRRQLGRRKAGGKQSKPFFWGETEYNHGVFVGFTTSGKKNTYASFTKGRRQLFHKDCTGSKALHKDQHQQL